MLFLLYACFLGITSVCSLKADHKTFNNSPIMCLLASRLASFGSRHIYLVAFQVLSHVSPFVASPLHVGCVMPAHRTSHARHTLHAHRTFHTHHTSCTCCTSHAHRTHTRHMCVVTRRPTAPRTRRPYILLHLKLLSSSTTQHLVDIIYDVDSPT